MLSAVPTLGVLVLPVEIPTHFTLWDEGKPRPYNISVFWFWAIEIPVCVGDPVVGERRRYSPRKPGGQLPTLRLQMRVPPQLFSACSAHRKPDRLAVDQLTLGYDR
jgi:hypothetical protein